ncbi:hypothetical protein Y032_0003g1235 [Ancylostoma ceylanicum]|nr:hypothetical protein Y032_0003g1235 [Ancylostoma ceylanicum]
MLVDHVAGDLNEVEDDCGLFEVIDAHQGYDVTLPSEGGSWSDKMSTLGHLVPKALARSGVESASFSDNLRQFFEAIMVEMENNIPSSFIHDFICHEVVTSLRDSLYPLFLPTPNILSRLFHDIAKPEFGQQFDAANAVYRLLMFFLYHFPACNEEGRFYWLQVLTDDPSNGDSPSSNGRRGSLLKWNSLLSRTAGFRKMVLDTFT